MGKEKEIVKGILLSYDEISNVREEDEKIFFSINNMEFVFGYISIENKTNRPEIMIRNDEKYDYPHIMPFRLQTQDDGDYRIVCLYASNETINFMSSYEEKIIETIDRLIHLLTLSPKQIEEEFQKEFLFYWNDVAKYENSIKIYLRNNKEYDKLNVYINQQGCCRVVQNGIKLNDVKSYDKKTKIWRHISDLSAFYIPIINNRGILPPTRGRMWDKRDIVNIIYGKDYNHISEATYQKLKKEKTKQKTIVLIFGMTVNDNNIVFAVTIHFRSSVSDTLFYKLNNMVYSVEPIYSKRADYYYLCEQIGNDTSILDKKVLLIGAGSMGSYVAKEIVKAGICNLTIYDSDKVEDENLLRHRVSGFWVGSSKVFSLKQELELLHPEIHVNAKNKDIDEVLIKEEMEKYDLIIFTVGNSDVQLAANCVLEQEKCSTDVLYVWLEAGGTNSHILYVDYSKRGCFECLFTDEYGNVLNNKANMVTEEVIEKNTLRNGCGATRVKYGTAILLRTTSVLLNVIQKVFGKEMEENCLFDITETIVNNRGNSFYEGKCNCCGIKRIETMYKNGTS